MNPLTPEDTALLQRLRAAARQRAVAPAGTPVTEPQRYAPPIGMTSTGRLLPLPPAPR